MHPLLGPRLKLAVADEKINALNDAIDRLKALQRKGFIVDGNPETGKFVVLSKIVAFPKPEWGVIIGEIAHDLRSALDNIFFQLVLLAGLKPEVKHSFPIFIKGGRCKGDEGSRFNSYGYGDGLYICNGLKRKHITILKRLQPYHRYNGRKRDPLWLLHELNNADKHRLIQTAIFYVRGTILGIKSLKNLNFRGGRFYGRGRILKDRAKLYEFWIELQQPGLEGHMKVQFDLTTEIVFAKGRDCEAIALMPIADTLRNMRNRISAIIESFAPEFAAT